MAVTGQSGGGRVVVTGQSQGNQGAVTWQSQGSHGAVEWQSRGSHGTVTGQSLVSNHCSHRAVTGQLRAVTEQYIFQNSLPM